jgi:hypothetical protein
MAIQRNAGAITPAAETPRFFPRSAPLAFLGRIPALVALCAPLACEGRNATDSASAIPSQVHPAASTAPPASAEQPPASAKPSAPPTTKAPPRILLGASADAIKDALRSIGWTPTGSRIDTIKGVKCITVLASCDGLAAEVRSFEGYPYGLQDMLELKDTAQGFGEMTMFTVLVKGDAAMTDKLYEQLMGSAPTRHGSGLGDSYDRKSPDLQAPPQAPPAR